MAKIEYNPRAGWKYPWHRMHEVGDYFDVTPEDKPKCRGVRNAAHSASQLSGKTFITKTLPDDTIRVMLIYIEPGLQSGPPLGERHVRT